MNKRNSLTINDIIKTYNHINLNKNYNNAILTYQSALEYKSKAILLLELFENEDIFYTKKHNKINTANNKSIEFENILNKYNTYSKFSTSILDLIYQILYFLSSDEIKARETEIATTITNLVRDKQMKTIFNDEYDRISKLRLDKVLSNYNSSYLILERISDLIEIIANYPELQKSIPINNVRNIFNGLTKLREYKDSADGIDINSIYMFNSAMFFIGIILTDNKMFNQMLIKSDITINDIKKFFTEKNLINYMTGNFTDRNLDKYIELVYENIMYLICKHLNTIYNIIHNSVDEFFDFRYNNDYDIENSINESYSYFKEAHSYLIDMILDYDKLSEEFNKKRIEI